MLARRTEIEEAVLARVNAIPGTAELDSEYAEGVRGAVSAAIEYGLAGIQGAGEQNTPIPTATLTQARVAARSGVGLDTVLRRYLAGYTVLGDFLIAETQKSGQTRGAPLKQLLRTQAVRFDRIVAAVSEEYAREAKGRPATSRERRAELVERLLGGELVDTSELSYEFEVRHVGIVAKGPLAPAALQDLAADTGCRLLAVEREDVLWAWFGSRGPLEVEKLRGRLAALVPAGTSLAFGERAEGLRGWRLTHRQARAALPIALREGQGIVRYREVAILASILQDDLLTTSLRELYLAPLTSERDGGELACETLLAYFAAERNVSSTAAALGVSRQTIRNRLQAIGEQLGRQPDSCAVELQLALQLEAIGKG